jgi:hypothetical protein
VVLVLKSILCQELNFVREKIQIVGVLINPTLIAQIMHFVALMDAETRVILEIEVIVFVIFIKIL